MTTYSKPALPALKSMWRDEEQNITYRVIGIDGDEVVVNALQGLRSMTDIIPLECFGTDLTFIH